MLLESKQMQSSMKQEGWFKRCAALSAFLVMTAATSAAQVKPRDLSARQEFSHQLVKAALERTEHEVRYDPAYVVIPYPGGDVPADTGVCTDEVSGSKIAGHRTVHDRTQHRAWAENRRCLVKLENHRPLPLFRAGIIRECISFRPAASSITWILQKS